MSSARHTDRHAEATVFVIEDDDAGRHSLCMLVETVGLAVEGFSRPREFLDAFDPSRPGCVILDIRLPEMSGIDVLEEIRARGSEIPVIMVTAYGDVPTAVRALKRGALDFIEKPFSDQAILAQVQRGVNEDLARHRRRRQLDVVRRSLDSLTPREREVLDLVVAGYSSKQIGDTLRISRRTVENHRARIKEKTGAATLAELLVMVQVHNALESGGR